MPHHHSHPPGHEHGHDHTHDHDARSDAMPFAEKMEKLLDHWIRHNTDHAESYTDWARQADENGMSKVGEVLMEVADLTRSLNEKFATAREHLHRS